MKTATKVWLILAFSLVLIGCLLFLGVMSMLKFDFSKLSTVSYQTNHYEISEACNGISLHTDTADIEFVLSDDGKCRVECYESEKEFHRVTVKDGILTVDRIDEKTVFNFIGNIGFNFKTPKITIYLPETEYGSLLLKESTGDIRIPKDFHFHDVDLSLSTGDVSFEASVADRLKIRTTTGDIHLEELSAGTLDLSLSTGKLTATGVTCQGDMTVGVTTGKIHLTDLTCQNLYSEGNTGDLVLQNVLAAECFSIQRTTGDVTFAACDASEITVKTDTGDITGNLLTEKVFIVATDTGKVSVPKSTTGGSCELTTNTGNIQITVSAP